MKKYFWVFWTFEANYATAPFRCLAMNFVEAIKTASLYNPYGSNEQGKRMRFIVFEEGGSLVWDGPCPTVGDGIGKVIPYGQIDMTDKGWVTSFTEYQDLSALYESEVSTDVSLPDCFVPFGSRVKWAMLVGKPVAGRHKAIYLCNKIPGETDLVFRGL